MRDGHRSSALAIPNAGWAFLPVESQSDKNVQPTIRQILPRRMADRESCLTVHE